MLILEGPDCSGKSTLASELSKYYNAPITHYTCHHRMGMLEHAVQGKPGTDEIVDRFHHSEVPYSLYHRQTDPDYIGIAMINRALLARKAITILCLPPWKEVKKQWYKRKKDELIQSETILRHIYKWYAAIRSDGVPQILYDYTVEDNLRYVTERIEALINARPSSNIIKGEPCGRFYSAKVLLVGESVGNVIQQEVPFTGIKASGPWLTQLLLNADIHEGDLAWINVKLSDGLSNMINVVKTCETYHYEYVIALGNVASEALVRKGIEHETVYHPQYWKRFHNKEEYPLITRLKEIL